MTPIDPTLDDRQPVIDIHTHLFPPSVLGFVDSGKPWNGSIVESAPNGYVYVTMGEKRRKLGSARHFESPARRIERMDELGVDIQVLSLLPPLFRYGLEPEVGVQAARAINDELAGIISDRPDRYMGLATLPLQDPAAAVREVERAVGELGFVGVEIGSHVAGRNLDDPDLFDVFRACAEQKAFVMVHPVDPRGGTTMRSYYMGNLIGNPWETTVAIGSLLFGGVIERLPGLRIGFAHAGGYAPFAIGRFDHGFRVRTETHERNSMVPRDLLRQLYFDALTHDPRAVRYLVDTVGIDHVVLGSDYPADMGPVDPAGEIRSSTFLDPAEKAAILGGSLVRVLSSLGHEVPTS